MKQVNEQSKLILDVLFEKYVNNGGHIKINNSDVFIPLVVEILYDGTLSLCHYGELNGDLMRDPEVIFVKNDKGNYYPIYFRNDYLGIESWYVEINGNDWKLHDRKGQLDLSEFCDTWLLNIKEQQNLQIEILEK